MGFTGIPSAMASFGSPGYADYMVDAMANSWTRNLGIDGYCEDVNANYGCMLQTQGRGSMPSWRQIVARVRALQPQVVMSGEGYGSWDDVARSDADLGGQGFPHGPCTARASDQTCTEEKRKGEGERQREAETKVRAEVRSALESVFPLYSVRTFCLDIYDNKVKQLGELCRLVVGILCFNAFTGKSNAFGDGKSLSPSKATLLASQRGAWHVVVLLKHLSMVNANAKKKWKRRKKVKKFPTCSMCVLRRVRSSGS